MDQSRIDRIEADYPQGRGTPFFDRESPISQYRALSVPDFNVSVQVQAERLMEQGQARAEQEERDFKARFELMVERTQLGGKEEARVADILTDVLATEGHGDMLRLLVRAGLNGDLIQIKGLCQAMVDEGAQIFADSEAA